jgi:hypothetical protein
MMHLSIAKITAGIPALVIGALGLSEAWAQGTPISPRGPWEMMHDWGAGGFWLMPLVMMTWFALLIAVIVSSLARRSPRREKHIEPHGARHSRRALCKRRDRSKRIFAAKEGHSGRITEH